MQLQWEEKNGMLLLYLVSTDEEGRETEESVCRIPLADLVKEFQIKPSKPINEMYFGGYTT